jgi:hypothetical protein
LQRGIFECSTTERQKPNSTVFDGHTAALLKTPITVFNDDAISLNQQFRTFRQIALTELQRDPENEGIAIC